MLEEKYSRLPVYRENIENIEGFIYVRDLLQVWADGKENSTIDSLVRDVYFVPETKLVDDLLEEMQRTHAQMTIVVEDGKITKVVNGYQKPADGDNMIDRPGTPGEHGQARENEGHGAHPLCGGIAVARGNYAIPRAMSVRFICVFHK